MEQGQEKTASLKERIEKSDEETIKVMAESSLYRMILSLNDNPDMDKYKKIRQVYDYAAASGYNRKQIRKVIEDCLIIGPGDFHLPRRRTPGKFFERGKNKK